MVCVCNIGQHCAELQSRPRRSGSLCPICLGDRPTSALCQCQLSLSLTMVAFVVQRQQYEKMGGACSKRATDKTPGVLWVEGKTKSGVETHYKECDSLSPPRFHCSFCTWITVSLLAPYIFNVPLHVRHVWRSCSSELRIYSFQSSLKELV